MQTGRHSPRLLIECINASIRYREPVHFKIEPLGNRLIGEIEEGYAAYADLSTIPAQHRGSYVFQSVYGDGQNRLRSITMPSEPQSVSVRSRRQQPVRIVNQGPIPNLEPQLHVPAFQPIVPIQKHPDFPILQVMPMRPPSPRNVPLTRSTGAHPDDRRPKAKLRFPDVTGIQPPPVRVVSRPQAKAEPVVIQPPTPLALPGQGLKEKGPPIDPEPANEPGGLRQHLLLRRLCHRQSLNEGLRDSRFHRLWRWGLCHGETLASLKVIAGIFLYLRF